MLRIVQMHDDRVFHSELKSLAVAVYSVYKRPHLPL